MKHKLIAAISVSDFQARVDMCTEDGWFVIVGSVGGMFSGSRHTMVLLWAILEKEIA